MKPFLPSRRQLLLGVVVLSMEAASQGSALAQSTSAGSVSEATWERLTLQGLDPTRVSAVLQQLKAAVRSDDVQALRAVSANPLRLYETGVLRLVSTPENFEEAKAVLMSPRLKQVVAAADMDSLFVNAQGAMLGDGDIWIGSMCGSRACDTADIVVSTVNILP
jgi:hypothetical protein